MKIKSIPDNPHITLSTLKKLIDSYETIITHMDDNKYPTELAYDCGRLSTYELFFGVLGVSFETGDQAQGHHIDNK